MNLRAQTMVLLAALAALLGAGCGHDHAGESAHGREPGHGHDDESPSGASFKAGKGVSLTEETRKILDWAMTAFEKKRLFERGETVGDASVYGGAASHVPLVTSEPVDVLVPVNNPERLTARVIYRWPLPMPVEAGKAAGTLKIWSAANGDEVRSLQAAPEQGWYSSVAFSPDGALLVTGTLSGEVEFWNVASGERLSSVELLSGTVLALAFRPDGGQVAVATRDGGVYLLEPAV